MTQHVNPYKTASELGITEREREALIAVGRDLAREDYNEDFNMAEWSNCICGKMCNWRASQGENMPHVITSGYSDALRSLFTTTSSGVWKRAVVMKNATREDAAEAIQNFLLGVTVAA